MFFCDQKILVSVRVQTFYKGRRGVVLTIILKARILSALNMLLWLRRIPANDGLTEVYCTLPCAPGVYSTLYSALYT